MKIIKRIEQREHCIMLQDDLNNILKVLRIDKNTKMIESECKMGDEVFRGTSDEQDLGVMVQDDLSVP